LHRSFTVLRLEKALEIDVTVGLLVDSEIGLSTRNDNVRVFINSRYINVVKSGEYQQDRYQQRPE
jgi:hypothetical protein